MIAANVAAHPSQRRIARAFQRSPNARPQLLGSSDLSDPVVVLSAIEGLAAARLSRPAGSRTKTIGTSPYGYANRIHALLDLPATLPKTGRRWGKADGRNLVCTPLVTDTRATRVVIYGSCTARRRFQKLGDFLCCRSLHSRWYSDQSFLKQQREPRWAPLKLESTAKLANPISNPIWGATLRKNAAFGVPTLINNPTARRDVSVAVAEKAALYENL